MPTCMPVCVPACVPACVRCMHACAFNQLYIANKTKHFSFKSGHDMQVSKLIKEDWPILEFWLKITLYYF